MSHYKSEHLFLVEGTLGELQIAQTTVNLLEQIDKHIKAKNAIAGTVAALSGLHGLAANAATIALYDGEDVYNFAATLDEQGEQVICGVFEHANQFKNGDPIKAVVSKRGDVFFAHAIMHANTQQFYMPLNTWAGDGAIFDDCMKTGWRFGIFGSIVFFTMAYFMSLDMFYGPQPLGEKILLFSMFLFGPSLLGILFELWTYSTVSGDGYAEAIFETFGFPRPKYIDLTEVGCMNHEENNGWQYAWQADKMLEKLKGKKS